MRILLCFVLCLVVFSCSGCPCCYVPKCKKTQDIAVIQTSNAFLDGRFFDHIMVRNNNRVVKTKEPRYTFIGSKCHNAKFPVHIEVRLFLRKDLRQSLEFDMPKNSMLNFYNGTACEVIPDSITTPAGNSTQEGEFYIAVQQAVNSKMFIDSSHSENACWVMLNIAEDDDLRCTQYDDDDEENICGD